VDIGSSSELLNEFKEGKAKGKEAKEHLEGTDVK
jgi:hypothetical protein